ncbi:MAG: protein translocase subunit SecF [Clostridiales bacterium]|jgi:preprotein translocase SecF subunit|nr:protein translocase subunit SecF [Clostridiales bacterium]
MAFDFVGKHRIFLIISLIVILAGLIVALWQGLNLGIDFIGGSLIYVNIGKSYSADDIRDILSSEGIDATVVQVGESKQDAMIRMRHMENQEAIQEKLISALKEKYELTDDKFNVESVGPTVGKDLTLNAFKSIIIAWIFMLIYIWLRFELKSGVIAVIALIHDVLVMIALAALMRTQINSPFVAAVLTIIGYSINNTIVIFDRIRENSKQFRRKLSRAEITNTSISQTLARSINTSLTTLLTVLALYIFGVESIKEFTLPIIVGLLGGTYSSIFIAGPLWAAWTEKSASKKPAAAK